MTNAQTTVLLARIERQLDEARDLRDETRAFASRQLLPGSTALVLAQLPREVTLSVAAARIAEAYNLLHGGVYNQVVRRGGELRLVTDDRDFSFAVEDPETILAVMEQTLFFTHALLALVVPAAADALVGVSLRRRSGAPSVPFGAMTRLRRGAAIYALRYDAEVAERPFARPPREDLTFEAVIRSQIALLGRLSGRAESVGERTIAALRGGAVAQADAAGALGVSTATLRRRLAAEGLTFRRLRQDILRERADALLTTGLPLPEIAERLGFSDVRSFNRAYAALAGVTPAVARRSGG